MSLSAHRRRNQQSVDLDPRHRARPGSSGAGAASGLLAVLSPQTTAAARERADRAAARRIIGSARTRILVGHAPDRRSVPARSASSTPSKRGGCGQLYSGRRWQTVCALRVVVRVDRRQAEPGFPAGCGRHGWHATAAATRAAVRACRPSTLPHTLTAPASGPARCRPQKVPSNQKKNWRRANPLAIRRFRRQQAIGDIKGNSTSSREWRSDHRASGEMINGRPSSKYRDN